MRVHPGVLFLGCICASVANGQAPARVRLGPPLGRLDAEFTRVTSIRELTDGRILVTDGRELRVVAGDFGTGAAKSVGRQGRGPEEYEGTTLLFALGADSSVMLDLSRRLILFHGARIVGQVAADAPVTREMRGFLHGADTVGHVLVHRSGTAATPGRTQASDSARVVLLDRATARGDTIAALRAVPSETRTVAQGGGSMTYRSFKPFPAGESARLFPDGWVAIVRLDPYRVDWRASDGRIIHGKPLPYEPTSVTDADRKGFRDAHPTPQGRPSFFDFDDFPASLPPFEYWAAGEPVLLDAPSGQVVIRRTEAASLPSNDYDVVDRLGRLMGTIGVAKRERIGGLGARGVYLVSRDEDGIERISRHAWPWGH